MIFSQSAIGYVGNQEALFARGLAWGLHQRGHIVRMLEERRNPALQRTLRAVGASASRQAFDDFPGIHIHSFEPRSGAALMEWIARELSQVDLAIVVDGLPNEVTRWVANLDHRLIVRVFVTFRPNDLNDERAQNLELPRYDLIFSSSQPEASIEWQAIQPTVAPPDFAAVPPQFLPDEDVSSIADPIEVAREIERMFELHHGGSI